MRNQTFHVGGAVLCCFVSVLPAALRAQGPVPDSPAIEQRVDAMIGELTLEQKVELIGGVDSMFIRAEPAGGLSYAQNE